MFGVNPNGVRYDGIFEGVTQRQFDWDGIWQAAARVTPEGWVLEMAIPFKTLSFDPGSDELAHEFRAQHRAQERGNGLDLAQSQHRSLDDGRRDRYLADRAGPRPRRRPFRERARPPRDRHHAGESATEPSVDVFYKLTPQLNASLTVNTDFSATEVDDRQVNLTRFSLFFPEKRDFFLQDVDIFQFGRLQQDGRPFFSRKLGIDAAGQPVPLDVGAKVSGRIGRFELGTLAVRQEAYENPYVAGETINATTAFVGRVAANVLAESSVGMIVTDGDPSSNRDNSVVGVDFRYQNSQLIGGKSLEGDAWFQQSDSEHLVGDDTAIGLAVRVPSNTGLRGEFGLTRMEAELLSGPGLRAAHGHRPSGPRARAHVAAGEQRDSNRVLRRQLRRASSISTTARSRARTSPCRP